MFKLNWWEIAACSNCKKLADFTFQALTENITTSLKTSKHPTRNSRPTLALISRCYMTKQNWQWGLHFLFLHLVFIPWYFRCHLLQQKITGSKNLGLKINQSTKFSHKGCFRKRPHWSVKRRYKQTSRTFPCLVGLFESNANGITTHLMNEIPLLCEVFFQVRKKLLELVIPALS